ncbi:ASCH domain-containing protein [Lentibacillus saliphilus]|uniref:ASCH domain-containing protein n=1 Tax=Lentibacillus saliphilus TaxID=2737028 RepID=UPI001FE6D772|nr:ASCH domain-containing protein [Lentibacillus saliphilus]
MRLYDQPFTSMALGKKTVEVRLYDDKRRRIKEGDSIEFTKLSQPSDQLLVEVTELNVFPTFKAMYESLPAACFDAEHKTIEEMVASTYTIYTPQQEQKWGTVAITVKVIQHE